MARLGGLSSDAFSPPTGLGSILRDHRLLTGVRGPQVNIGFGMVRAPVAYSVSVSSSPRNPFLLAFGAADDSDDTDEEGMRGLEDSMDDIDSGISCQKFRIITNSGLFTPPNQTSNGFKVRGISSTKTEELIPVNTEEKVHVAADVFGNGESISFPLCNRKSENSLVSGRARMPHRPSASRMILTSAVGSTDPSQIYAKGKSAPREVPNWSKVIGHNDKADLFDSHRKETKDDDDDRLPPHELLAVENARIQRTTFSVCEGLGRTLKGRDLSRMRNAVWSQMGFAD